jgi:hypothetical protein
MYGVERSVVALVRDVGIAEGTAMLVVKGNVGVTRLGVVVGGVALLGSSHSVCYLSVITFLHLPVRALHTLFVLTWKLIRSTELVMLFTRSAVPMPFPLPNPMPQPRFGLFGSPIVLATARTTVLRLIRSWTAGVARAAGARMTPVTSMAAGNMPDDDVASDQ